LKILLIATYLPPYSGSGNIRLLNYINYLNRLENEITVVGVDYPRDSIAYDATLEKSFDDNIDIIRLNPGFFYNIFNRKKVDLKENHNDKVVSNRIGLANKLKQKINRFIKTTVLIPDAFVGWIRPAYNTCCKLIYEKNFDVILTIHETPSSHIVGYKLKKKFKNLNWIGYWSDPWNGDSALRYKNSMIKSLIEERIEKNIVKTVDRLLFTTNSTKDMYIKKYKIDKEKADIVYRGYELDLYEKLENIKKRSNGFEDNKINIVHTGTIYKELRDITPLFNALLSIKDNNVEFYEKFNFIFVGQFTDEEDRKLLSSLEAIKVINYIPFEEAMKYVVDADFLLLYGNKNSTQVPGKLYEYIGSKAPIITLLGSYEDELSDIMKLIDKGPSILNDKESILGVLESISNPNNIMGNWSRRCEEFEWQKVVLDLQSKLQI
jgi:glycosyltransferase involved in cell wall biosynthesis